MKINEVVNEIKNPYLRGIVQGITGIDFQPMEKPASQTNLKQPQPTVTSGPAANEPTLNIPQQTPPTPGPTKKPTPTPTPTPTGGLPSNVSVLSSSPLVLQVGKKRFELDDMDQWHPLGMKRTVSAGEAAILNRYLSML